MGLAHTDVDKIAKNHGLLEHISFRHLSYLAFARSIQNHTTHAEARPDSCIPHVHLPKPQPPHPRLKSGASVGTCRINIAAPHRLIAPAAACRIMSASMDVTRSSPLTSASAHHLPMAASWSAIAASAGVISPSPLRSPRICGSCHGSISGW